MKAVSRPTRTRSSERLTVWQSALWSMLGAHCADRRQPDQQAALFTPDGKITVHAGDPGTKEPIQNLTGHAAMAEAFEVLSGYDVTTHFTGPSSSNSMGTKRPARPTASRITCGWITAHGL
jgi:SnoaL-like domain